MAAPVRSAETVLGTPPARPGRPNAAAWKGTRHADPVGGGWERAHPTPDMDRLTGALTVAGSWPDVRFRVPLRRLLDDARAAYVIRSDGRALVRRVDPAVGAAVEEALKAADQPERGSASRHLRQAMDLAYALRPDPVKAYSEAIKAVECALHDTIQPNNRRATLGTMKGELPQLQNKLRSAITGPNGGEGLETALKMMTLLWEGQTPARGPRPDARSRQDGHPPRRHPRPMVRLGSHRQGMTAARPAFPRPRRFAVPRTGDMTRRGPIGVQRAPMEKSGPLMLPTGVKKIGVVAVELPLCREAALQGRGAGKADGARQA